jgi:hypothetical protein
MAYMSVLCSMSEAHGAGIHIHAECDQSERAHSLRPSGSAPDQVLSHSRVKIVLVKIGGSAVSDKRKFETLKPEHLGRYFHAEHT